MTQKVMKSTTHTVPETTRKSDPDLFHPDMSWDELREQWAKAQHGI